MRIMVNSATGALGGGPRVVPVDGIKGTDRIKAVRAKIVTATNTVPAKDVMLSMGGRILEDEFTVADYDVKPNANVFMM